MTDTSETDAIESLHQSDSELVIGLAGAVGTDLKRIGELIEKQLDRAFYRVHRVKISKDVIPLFGTVEYKDHEQFDRITKLMDAGNAARESSGDASVLALGAAAAIAAKRKKEDNATDYRTAYIVDSLKRPEEVERLRKVYPGGFVLIGVYAEQDWRRQALRDVGVSEEDAQKLIERDAKEVFDEHGQRLEETFYLSDAFIRIDGTEEQLRSELRRIVELLFGYPFHTPSFDEYAMFFAFAAALRSADLSRQVGAVIARDDRILATGANDCPRPTGGLYWPERDGKGCLRDSPDGRDHMRGYDSNKKEQLDMIEKLANLGEKEGLDRAILKKILESKASPIRDLTEYGRVVHAEMDALTTCARSQLSTSRATLYCTTFPCHNCAKHIVAAGINRVVYIEPYEKSKALEFHNDSIVFGSEQDESEKVCFEPFVGVGPRRFFDLFSMNLASGYDVVRKDSNTGRKVNWEHKKARLRIQMLPSTYLDLEYLAANLFEERLAKKGVENGKVNDSARA